MLHFRLYNKDIWIYAYKECLTFQYYNQSVDAVYYLSETLGFEINMVIGDVMFPHVLTFNPGDDVPDSVYGCIDDSDGDGIKNNVDGMWN